MDPNMGSLGHVTRLARQQQEHTYRFAISHGRHVAGSARRSVGLSACADGGQHPKIAPAPSERDRVVHRTAARIQHDGRAGELPATREFIEIPWSILSHDTDRADPVPAIRLASDPAKLHRLVASFEGNGSHRTAQHSYQRDAKSGANELHAACDSRPTISSNAWTGDAGKLRSSGPRHEHDSVT